MTSIDSEHSGTLWEVEVVTRDGVEHKLKISVDDGSVVSGPTPDRDDADDRAERRAEVRAAKLGYLAAAKIMTRTVRNGRPTELNLDDEDGRVVWEGDLVRDGGTKRVVKLDAGSGKVISNRADADDRSDDDRDDDD